MLNGYNGLFLSCAGAGLPLAKKLQPARSPEPKMDKMDYDTISGLGAGLEEIIYYQFGIEIKLSENFDGFNVDAATNTIHFHKEYVMSGSAICLNIPTPTAKLWSNIQLSIESICNAITIIEESAPDVFGDTEESDDAQEELNAELGALTYLIETLVKRLDPSLDLWKHVVAAGCPICINTSAAVHDRLLAHMTETDFKAFSDLQTAKRYKKCRPYLNELTLCPLLGR